MKKVTNTITAATLGIVIGSSMTALAGTYVQAYKNTEMNLSMNGQICILRDETTGEREYPLTYNNRTYIPLRSVATLFGYDIGYDNATNTATVNTKDYVEPEKNQGGSSNVEKMDLTKIEYLKNLKISDKAPTYYDEMFFRRHVSNIINSIYTPTDDKITDRPIHSQSPFKDSYFEIGDNMKLLSDQKNAYVHSDLDGVKIVNYLYDTNGTFRGVIASWKADLYKGSDVIDSQSCTSFFLNDENDKYFYEGTSQLKIFAELVD